MEDAHRAGLGEIFDRVVVELVGKMDEMKMVNKQIKIRSKSGRNAVKVQSSHSQNTVKIQSNTQSKSSQNSNQNSVKIQRNRQNTVKSNPNSIQIVSKTGNSIFFTGKE